MVNTGHRHYQEGDTLSAENAGWGLYSSVFAGILLGWGVDHWLGTEPILLVVGLLAGAGVGFWRLWLYLKGSGR